MGKRIAVIGSGQVGQTLANGFLAHGHSVMRASRDVEKLANWKQHAEGDAEIGTPQQAAEYGDIIVLAVKGSAAEAALDSCGVERLVGKVVIDPTNPIADAPPDNGVLRYFTDINDSLMERLQRKAPKTDFVKAFSCVGNARMVNPDFGGTKPSMFICGNSSEAKDQVSQLLQAFGWDVEDMGGVEAARAIEPLCMLWCIPGFKHNQWRHAFKLLKPSDGSN